MQLRRAAVLAVERMVENDDVGIAEREPEFGAELEVVGDDARSRRHLHAARTRRVADFIPTGEIRRIPLLRSGSCPHIGKRHRDVVAHHRNQAEPRDHGGRASPHRRPAGEEARQQRHQCDETGHRPVEAHALGVREEAEHEEAGDDEQAQHRAPARGQQRAAQAVAPRLQQRDEEQRRDQQRLDRDEPQAARMEGPRMALDQLETQAGVGVVVVPPDQRRPRGRAEDDGHDDAHVLQQAAAVAASRAKRGSRRRSPATKR